MKANCHRCGKEYLAARNLAGKTVRCWSCGATNDGAGVNAPMWEESFVEPGFTADDDGLAASGSARPARPPPAPASLGRHPRPEFLRRTNLIVVAISCGLVFLAAVGALAIWILTRPVDESGEDWGTAQRAVPRLVSPAGSGSGFLTEIDGRLWLVTSYRILRGGGSIKAIFHDPQSHAGSFSIDVEAESAIVHDAFPDSFGMSGGGGFVAIPVETWRPQFEGVGIAPLPVAGSGRLRAGTPVVALGFLEEVQAADSEGLVDARGHTPSLVRGVVSAVRSDVGGIRRLTTDARIGSGFLGGPLMLASSAEVAAISAWQDGSSLAPASNGMVPAIAADHLYDLVGRGVSLSAIRSGIAAGSRSPLPDGIEHPETAWSRFPTLEDLWEGCRREGWEWVDSVIRVTGDHGKDRVVHRLEGEDSRQVALLVFPESPLVDLNVVSFGPVGLPAASDRLPSEGMPILTVIRDPGSGDPASMPGGQEVVLELVSRFLGRPIQARYVAIFIRRVPPAASSPSPASVAPAVTSPGGSSPPDPVIGDPGKPAAASSRSGSGPSSSVLASSR